MAGIPFDATAEQFAHAQFTVEAVYREMAHGGVSMIMTTGASNISGCIKDWEVFNFPGACIHAPLWYWTSYEDVESIGKLGRVDESSKDMANIEVYCRANPGLWYHAYAGYNIKNPTLDRNWYAVDVYIQTPSLAFSPVYVWYIVLDSSDPKEWYKGRIAWMEGVKTLGEGRSIAARL